METKRILDQLYPGAARPRRSRRALRLSAWFRRNSWYLGIGLLALLGWLVAHLYYYNRLVDMEYNVQEAWAQVETQFQRRFHIQQNLTRMVLEYAKHERDLLMRLTRLRVRYQQPGDLTGAGSPGPVPAPPAAPPPATGESPRPATAGTPPAPPRALNKLKRQLDEMSPKELNDLFPQIQFMAEQYPKLRLSENFQQFSKATIDTENKIAEAIRIYNKAVNIYTTILKQFPGVIFGKACGFTPYEFYVPDRATLDYRPVDLRGPS